MKKNYFAFCLVFVTLVFISININAQVRYVDVVPGVGTLNDAISGDTAATGERNDPLNTIYRLQRGPTAYYGLTGTISNTDFPLTIMAEEGDGARPFLQPRVVGDASSAAFRPRADVKLVGLHVTNLDDLGGLNDRILRCSADGLKVYADDCWFDKASQSFIRTDNPGQSYFITNCVISNIGHPTSPDNGRGIDDRGNDIDTIMFENCTFYNFTSRIIRDDGTGSITKYIYMNNNTMANIAQWGIAFGPTEKLVVTNNISVNAGFLPKDDDNGWVVFSVDSVAGVAPMVTMTNNSIYLDSAKLVPYLNDTMTITPVFNPTLAAALFASGTVLTNMFQKITFTDGPPFNDSMLIYYYNPAYNAADAPFWEEPVVPSEGEGGNGIYHLDVPYDFGYVNSKAFIAGTDGMQLGDRNWTADRDVMGMVNFENPLDLLFWRQQANAGDAPENLAIMPNPDMSGMNTSPMVMMLNIQNGAEPRAGAWSDVNGYMEFTQNKHHMEVMVWKSIISNRALKVEQGGTATELKVPNTVTNAWELLTFDFSANIGETLTRLVFMPDFSDPRTAGTVAYFDNIQIVIAPVGIETAEGLNLKVYPNPATDQLIVQCKGMTRLIVRDILGHTLKSIQLKGVDYTTVSVDDLVEGVYFISIGTEGGSITTKFLKR